MVISFDWQDGVPRSEFSNMFIQGMLARMAMSYSTYGRVKEAFPDKVDALKSMEARIKKYRETKNREWLMDAANFLMIEFMCPSLEDTFFEATMAKESPGRKWHGEGFTKDQNVE